VQQGQIVLVDTNIIIEAFRARCWKALTAYYRVETVEKCYEEALTGDRLRPGYVEVEPRCAVGKIRHPSGCFSGTGHVFPELPRR